MDSRFPCSQELLYSIIGDILARARAGGASDCEAEVSQSIGLNLTVRQDDVETIEYNRDKGIGITVYLGQRKGHASTSDLSPAALQDTVDAALAIARFTASDEFSGLADADLLAREVPDLDLDHPWPLSVDEAIVLAQRMEQAAFAVDPRINNSEGASVSVSRSMFVYGNSRGFIGGYPTSRHAVSCAVIAESAQGMQRDYWYSTARAADDLEDVESVGRRAGERTLRRLDARRLKTMEVPVLFEAPVASSLIGHFVGAASGGSLYRRASFLLDARGKPVFSPRVQIVEDPFIPRGLASSPFDNEGVATQRRQLVQDGVLNGYFLSSYSARKLGLRSTGNAGGNHNLVVQPTGQAGLDGLLREMGRGLFVTELLGHGINNVTGDYSRGAAGFWVENGVIQYPVEEITIAGNLKDMYRDIVAIGSDVLVQGSKQCGSILIGNMTVAGD